MAIADHRIDSVASFKAVTAAPRKVAGIYYFSVLDRLVDLAHSVSGDFFARPYLYTNGRPSVSAEMAKLRARYGADERIPSKEQRDAIYVPLFGDAAGNDSGDFKQLRNELVQATTAFAERVYDTGVQMLLERVRSAHRPFREYLVGLEGASVDWSGDEVLPNITLELAYRILRNDGVAAVFGISQAPKDEWPFDEDANGDKLVREISRQLPDTAANGSSQARRNSFGNVQRSALRGAEAIATVIDFPEDGPDDDLLTLISKCYTWEASIAGATTATAGGELLPASTYTPS